MIYDQFRTLVYKTALFNCHYSLLFLYIDSQCVEL